MNYRFFLGIVFISFLFVSPISAQTYSSEVKTYFKEIALKAEYGDFEAGIKKWQNDMKIYLMGEKNADLERELDRILQELNTLIEPIRLKKVSTQSEANFIIFLGDANTYIREIEPATRSIVKNNLACFWVNYRQGVIYRGSMYVDVIRLKAPDSRRHLLREELTQALGLMNDSERYRDSIFYQKWTRSNQYSEMDKQLIRLLYDPQIKAGMPPQKVNQILKKL